MHEAQYFNPTTRLWSTVYFPIPDASASTALIGDYVYQTVRVYGSPQKLVRSRIILETAGSQRFARMSNPGLSSAPGTRSSDASTVAAVLATIVGIIVIAIAVFGMKKLSGPGSVPPPFVSSSTHSIQSADADVSLEWDNDDVGMPTLQVVLASRQQLQPQLSPTLSRRSSPRLGRKVTK